MIKKYGYESKYAKTYKTEANADRAVEKTAGFLNITYIVVPTSTGRFQPIITNSDGYAASFAHAGFSVVG